ncbi:hypothetical protein WJX81_001899 [Elliptochloris bilobata]|uniref:Angio-associated migratory cell protein n=1 Tax=Elliptochloris bilobata TaxID=381761 RepID=A0AAW1RJT3_9CHLO
MHESEDDFSDSEAFVADDEGVLAEGGQVVAEYGDSDACSSGDDAESAPEEEPETVDEAVQVFCEHTDAVFAVAWSPAQEDMVATGSGDDRTYLWQVGADQSSGKRGLGGHSDTVASLAFNAAGTLLASGGLDGRVNIWESSCGRCLQRLEGPGDAVEWLAWHPRGDVLLAGSEDFTAWMWNAASGACMQVLTGHHGAVTCGSFTPDGKRAVTGGGEGDASLRVWNPKTGECTSTIQGHGFHKAGLTALGVHGDSHVVITGAQDGSAHLTNVETGRMLGELAGHTDSVESAAFSPAVVRLAFHPTAALVYTGCLDGVVRAWDARTGTCVQTRTGHQRGIQDLALSRDGWSVITGSDDTTARIFTFSV